MSIQTAVSQPARLTRGAKLAYGTGDMAGSVVVTLTGFFLQAFLLDVAGLRPAAVGVIFLVSSVWDAVTDPMMGVISDRTRTRWGSKRPWLLFGAVPFGVAYFLHWLVPDLGPVGLFAYYLAVSLLLKTAYTVVNVPYAALTPALTQDYDERTQLNTYRFSLNLFGSLLAVVLHPVLVSLAGDDVARGYLLSAGVWGVFIAATVLTAFGGTAERTAPSVSANLNLWRDLTSALRNRAFLLVTGIYLCSWLALLTVQANLLLFFRYWADIEAQFTGLILSFQVAAILSLSLWAYLSKRIGKRAVYTLGALLWAAGLALFFFLPPGAVLPAYGLATLIGVGAAVAYLIPWSMLPDVVDDDELRTGERREGVFYGMFVFLQKLGLSLGLAVSSFALDATGYLNPEAAGAVVTQPDGVLLTLRLLVSFVPAALLLISLPFVYYYPLTRERYAEIRARLDARPSKV